MAVDSETPVAARVELLKHVVVDSLFTGLEATGVINAFGDLANERVPGLIKVHWVNPESEEKFIRLTAEGYRPLAYAGHFVWYDAVLASEACFFLSNLAERRGLGENLSGFALTLAKSVKEGHQSRFMQAIYPKMEEFANARHVDFVPITRKKDEKYGLHKGLNLDDLRPLLKSFRQKGIGGMIFPGGSVEPGRHPKDGSTSDINGLLEITDPDLWNVFKIMDGIGHRNTGQKAYFLPVGINKGYRLQNADSRLPTPEALVSLYPGLSEFLGKIGFSRVNVNINLGTPILIEEVVRDLGSEWESRIRDEANESQWSEASLVLNDYLMRRAASLLEEEQARGFYK